MRILVTGSNGFVGKNLVASLKNIRDRKDRRECFKKILPLYIYECDRGTSSQVLEDYCKHADFVFHLAGANRPKDQSGYVRDNYIFTKKLLDCLQKGNNKCSIMFSSSIQASLEGRYSESEYGNSKLASEELLFAHSETTGARVFVYRLPNLYGKWCKPNYNSVIATFCHNIANDLPITVNDPNASLELLYIDDLIESLLQLLLGRVSRCDFEGTHLVSNPNGKYCYVGTTDRVQLGYVARLLKTFKESRELLTVPEAKNDSFCKKLLSTYMSFLPPEKLVSPLKKREDDRGAFIEFLHTDCCGQLSINVSLPNAVKGNHWHHSKWEKFCVISGNALIKVRPLDAKGKGDLLSTKEYYVSGDNPVVIDIPPGMTHSIRNLSDNNKLVTLMWANENFNEERPDTYFEEV